jgi:myo-inositol-1(or 4)-monophosphatase
MSRSGPTPPPFASELHVARRAAAEAARILRLREGIAEVREKAGLADLVSAVDEAAEAAVLRAIRAHFPDDAVLAEESGAAGEGERRWIVDPLDGTINYLHGHPFVCVSICFADAAGPAAAVIHAPFLGEVYHAVRGGGSWRNDEPIEVSRTTDPRRALLATGFPFKEGKGDPETYFRLVAELLRGCQGVRRAGSAALDLAYVAAGRVDGFFEVGLSPWDVAAGVLLVEEAGGRCGGWPGDERGPVESGRVLASNGRLHGWLEETTGRYVPPL